MTAIVTGKPTKSKWIHVDNTMFFAAVHVLGNYLARERVAQLKEVRFVNLCEMLQSPGLQETENYKM